MPGSTSQGSHGNDNGNGATSLVECNGGLGHHQPSHFVNLKEDKENEIVSSQCHEMTKIADVDSVKYSRSKSRSRSCHSQWTPREKYLLIICSLLFLSCVAFILIAFIRDKVFGSQCPCHERPIIHTTKTSPSASSYSDGTPSLVLVCNVSETTAIYHPAYWWILPDGSRTSGNLLILQNTSMPQSGTYTCFVNRTSGQKHFVTSTSIDINTDHNTPHPELCLTSHCIQTAAQILDSMDAEIDPCDNFFQYACGNWNKKNFIPEDKTSYNTFEKLYDELQLTLKALLEDAPKQFDSQATLKAKTLYQSCINVSQIEIVGETPLRRVLEELGRWPVIDSQWSTSSHHLEDILGDMRGKYNAPILMDCWIGPDDKNSSVNIIQLDEPALGMPSREYYLQNPDSPDIKAYLKYMCDIAVLLGANPNTVRQEMTHVLKFETMLANVSKPQNEKHDTGARYRKVTIGYLHDTIPQFNWLRYFNRFLPQTVDGTEEIVVFSPEFLVDVVKLINETDKRIISNFVLWRLILSFIPELTVSFQEVRNDYRRVLQGVMRDKPRWNKCVDYLNERLGMATGAMFVHEKFRKESKDTALEMIGNLRVAFNDLLEENDWMDSETRAVAREKANAIKERIGYPDFIVDPVELDKKLELLQFNPDQYFENILRVGRYDANKTMAKFREPVNKDVWEQEPAVVNAFYNPNTNDIVFPAGMLQPPFYSEYFPKSLNYGGIGVVIGHEITHGFDDKGRQYDKDGNMKQWWKNETIEAFRHRAECIIKQYSNVQLEQIQKNIDGKNTQGENIADNGGLKQAYRAYKMWEKRHGPEPLLPGLHLTHDQLFFLNFAQIWCGNMRDKAALEKIRTSVHSPGPVRAWVPLANSEDFSRAFSCPVGTKMNPVNKCSVW